MKNTVLINYNCLVENINGGFFENLRDDYKF